jgi:NAD(P)-dependent dehydrogenase (short-subunit alcohol dehydrogenase family)
VVGAGIGAAIADGFAHAKAIVMITGKEEEPIESYRGRYKYYQIDVADEAGVKRLAEEIPELDVLINCAGMANREIEWSNEGFKRGIDVNLVGMLNPANAFKPHLTRSKRGGGRNCVDVYVYGLPPHSGIRSQQGPGDGGT